MESTRSNRSFKNLQPSHLFIGFGVIALLGIGVYAMKNPNTEAQETTALIKEQRTASDREALLKEVSNQSVADQAPIAQERFEAGCLLVADRETNQYVSLANGSVSDPVTGLTLIDGSVVCDFYGMTGIVQGGVVTQTAFNPAGFKFHPDYQTLTGN